MQKKIALVIESSSDASIFGRVNYDDNLIMESAKNLETLSKKMKKLLKNFHELKPESIEFEIQYDITGLYQFKKKSSIRQGSATDKSCIIKKITQY